MRFNFEFDLQEIKEFEEPNSTEEVRSITVEVEAEMVYGGCSCTWLQPAEEPEFEFEVCEAYAYDEDDKQISGALVDKVIDKVITIKNASIYDRICDGFD